MRRYVVAAAAVLMHLCLGGIYAWSTFVPSLTSCFGYSATQTQFIFGFTVAVLCLASLIGGRMQDVYGPRIPACISGILVGGGYLVAGMAGDSFWGLVLGIGILCGGGVAFGYVTSIAAAAKWFPCHRGLITGIVVAGYGCAAIVLSSVAEVLLAGGWHVLRIFTLIGCVYGPVLLIAGLLLSVPDNGDAIAVRGFRRTGLLADRRFWRLLAGIACATYPGLALIGSLKPIGIWHGFSIATSAASVSAFAVGNGMGRISWGRFHDRHRGGGSVAVLMAGVAASVVVFAIGGSGAAVFLIGALFAGFCYGGALAVFPSEVANIYGINVLGSVYPVILLAHGAAALVAAPLTGYGVDLTGGYWPGMALAFVAGLLGILSCRVLRDRV